MVDEARMTSPYVGPRPFERRHQGRFFGRERETRDLYSLVVSERVLLLYAESGAGKTSLINAGLVPRLEEEGFEVLPVARVQGVIPQGFDPDEIDNVYAFNVLLSWTDEGADLKDLAVTSLLTFLSARARGTDDLGLDAPRVAVFDQFEELFSAYPDRWSERAEFLAQVHDALEEDPLLRVVFVMREDHIARLDPYARLLPGALGTRFRLERLREGPALEAVTAPLSGTGRSFADGAAEALVEELLELRANTGAGKTVSVRGEFVEPVQLQVVCQTLWQDLPPDVSEITHDHLQAFGDVVQALSGFYERSIAVAVAETRVGERELRNWFQRILITPAETRSTVYRGAEETGRIQNETVDVLEDLHLIRAELRSGARWYELTHDRLIKPILASNQAWYEQFPDPLALAAQAWAASGRDEQALYRGAWLQDAQARMEAHPDSLTELDKEFVRASQKVAWVREKRRRRWVYTVGATVVVLLAILAGWAVVNLLVARTNAAAAEVYWLTGDAADYVNTDRELSVLLAIRALQRAEDARDPDIATKARDALDRALQQVLQHRDKVRDVAFSPDGQFLATAGADNWVRIWDVASGRERFNATHNDAVLAIAFSGDGSRLASASADRTAVVWNLSATKVLTASAEQAGDDGITEAQALHLTRLRLVKLSSAVSGVALSRDGTRLATVSTNGEIKVWNVDSGEVIFEPGGETFVSPSIFLDVALSPEGHYLVAAGADGAVLVWDAETGKEIRALKGHKGAVQAVSFDRDGARLATAGLDKRVVVWDVASWESILELTDPEDQVLDAAFSWDGGRLATASANGRVVVWDLTSGAAPFTFSSHTDSVNAVAFDPSGERVATASSDHTVRLSWVDVYQSGIEDLTEMACERAGRNLAWEEWREYVREGQPDERICPNALVHPSIVLWYVRRGEVERARDMSSSKAVAQAYLDLGKEYTGQQKYEDALAALDQAVIWIGDLTQSQAVLLAHRYGSICALARSPRVNEEDLPKTIVRACRRAVELAAGTDDIVLNHRLCKNQEVETLAGIVSPACARVDQLSATTEGVSWYIFGLHGPGGEYLMQEQGKRGWILFTEEIGHDPTHRGGSKGYESLSDEGFGIIVRLNNGYHPRGTIPYSDEYENFARRVGNFVDNSKGAHVWVIGNNMNWAIERPQDRGFEEVITPERYAECYARCWQAIHSLRDHKDDQVVVGAVAPWNNHTTYPGNETGDWVQYLADVLRAIEDFGSSVDAIALHTRTHGSDPDLIFSDAKMIPPYQDRYYHFRAYRDFMNAIPEDLRHVPVYITTTDQGEPWLDVENSKWVQNAYSEINSWNAEPGNQRIRALILYRWPKFDRLSIQGKGYVIEDFRRAMENEYVWYPEVIPSPILETPTGVGYYLYIGNLSYGTTEDVLRKLFQAYGEVVSVRVVIDRYTGRSRGFAFVGMATLADANAAMAALNGQLVDGRKVKVSRTLPPQSR